MIHLLLLLLLLITYFICQVFDAYAQFEESMISAKMETTAEMGATEEGIVFLVTNKCKIIYVLMVLFSSEDIDLELRLARFENLMDRRPLLLSRLVINE